MPADGDRLETWTGKTVMVFCAHQDDEIQITGTMALLVRNERRKAGARGKTHLEHFRRGGTSY